MSYAVVMANLHKRIRSMRTAPSSQAHLWEVCGHWSDGPTRLRTDIFYLLSQCAVAFH